MRKAAGTPQTLPARRARALDTLQKHHGVQTEQVLRLLDVADTDHIGEDHLAVLNGIHVALRDGETTVEEAFPDLARDGAGEVQQPRQRSETEAPAAGAETEGATGPVEMAPPAEAAGDATVLISRDQRKAILKAAKTQQRDLEDVIGYIAAKYQVSDLSQLPAYLATTVAAAMGDPATEIP